MRYLEMLVGRSAEASIYLQERLEAGKERVSNEARSPGNAPEGGYD